ncbi:hypothetical protein [Cyanobacterium stanieri]|nr:hypothetical protein [Cyanobacterium stanieri]
MALAIKTPLGVTTSFFAEDIQRLAQQTFIPEHKAVGNLETAS